MSRLVLFDADGVLLDSLTPHLRICEDKNRAYALGLTIPTPAQLKDMVRRNVKISPMKDFFRAVGFPEGEAERADQEYRAAFARDYPSPLFAGVHAALASLRDAGFTLGIVTANVRANVVAGLGPSAALFRQDCVLAKDTSPGGKSDAIVAAMALCATSPEATVYVGDQPGDWEAARAAGVGFVGAAYGWGIAPHGSPFPVIGDISELPDCLRRLLP